MDGVNAGGDVAVLIDGDNISANLVVELMAEVAKYGNASVRRIYGDWTKSNMTGWKECLLKHSISPIQQFAYTTGKNATDGAMIIDAMDLMYTRRFSSFCLVTSDSDFTRLATRIREQGVFVYGFGNKHNTHRALVAACNKFVYLDGLLVGAAGASETTCTSSVLASSSAGPSPPAQAVPTGPRALTNAPSLVIRSDYPQGGQIGLTPQSIDEAALAGLRRAVESTKSYEEDFVNLADLGDIVPRILPDLNPRNYGYRRWKDFVLASGIMELKMKQLDNKPPIALVRLSDISMEA